MMRLGKLFSASVWGNYFISCTPTLKNGGSDVHQHLDKMKEKVRSVLQINDEIPSQKLIMIDTIQRLGVSYHFEREIEEILQDMYNNTSYSIDKDVNDLCTIALWFRLLRQQGYSISCDIFDKFRDDTGNFKVALIHDILGMLSLYEAANLKIHGEDVLDQALAFTTFHLENSLSDMSSNLKEKVIHALNHPFYKGVRRIEAKYYIYVYSREVSKNDLLLQFAILDFNVLQAKHKEELSHLTEWWQKYNIDKTVPYARDRLVESFLWSVGVYFEPQYRIGRKILAKLVAIITIVDDAYDAYGTVEDLEPFTEAIKRRDINIINSLPEVMKVPCKAMLDLFEDMELLTAENGTSRHVQFVIQEVQKAVYSYLVEAKWRDSGYIPTFDEYLENGLINAFPSPGAASFLGLGHIATREVFEWITNEDRPKMVKAIATACRMKNDIVSHKFERNREHVASSVECLINQYGISEEDAFKILNQHIENAWKDVKEECLKPCSVPAPVLERAVNYFRVVEFLYSNSKDGFTNAELLKDHVAAAFLEPIRIEQY